MSEIIPDTSSREVAILALAWHIVDTADFSEKLTEKSPQYRMAFLTNAVNEVYHAIQQQEDIKLPQT